MKKHLIALLAVSATSLVMAQDKPYAKITELEGLSTVSAGNQLTNGAAGMPLVQGSQLVTGNNGTALVEFASGCSVKIGPAQTLKIEDSECRALLATRSAAPAANMTVAYTALGVAAGVGIYDATRSSKKTPVAPTPPAVTPVPPKVPVAQKPVKKPISRS